MLNVLLVSSSEKTSAFFREFFNMQDDISINSYKQASKARRIALETSFDIIIINYPLLDENDFSLPLDFAEKSDASIIMLTNSDIQEAITTRMERSGVFVIGKPVNRVVLYQVLKFALITQRRLDKFRMKTTTLSNKLQEIKIIDRAKCILIEKENLSENEAHRYIEKHAMDTQMSRLSVAKYIINQYQK